MIEPQQGEQAMFDAAIVLPSAERVAYVDRVTTPYPDPQCCKLQEGLKAVNLEEVGPARGNQ